MNATSRSTGFPGALLLVAAMFTVFAASTQTTWLRLISLAGLALVIAAAAYRMTRGERPRG